MPASKVNTICKSEQCLSCMNKSEAYEDGEEMVIICALESTKGTIKDDSLEECPSYQTDGETNPSNLAAIEEFNERVEEGKMNRQSMVSKIGHYNFVGDSLIEVPNPGKKEHFDLPAEFVEAYNLRVAEEKTGIKEEIERIQGLLEERLSNAKNLILEMTENGEGVTGLTVDDIFIGIAGEEDIEDDEEDEEDEELEEDDSEEEGEEADDEDEDMDEEDKEEIKPVKKPTPKKVVKPVAKKPAPKKGSKK